VPVPDGLDDQTAATSYINPLTAWALTISGHNLKEGDWLLQTAAASSVGKLVLQLAQQYRFKTINVIRRREQQTIIRNFGGNEVICTADEDLRACLQELTGGKGVERAIDCVAGELGAEIARNLAPAGTMLVYGALSSHRQTDPAKFTMPLFAPRLIYSTATVRGWWLPRWVSSEPLAAVRTATSDLLTMLSSGALTAPAIVRYSFKDFQEAVCLADGEAGQQTPTASTVPEPSLCGMTRGYGIPMPNVSSRFFTSPGFTPEKAIRIRTSPARGCGWLISPTTNTSRAVPGFSYQAAFML
jgi:NADPH:quinone reductase-like Zn-dependent oxidoreductase